MDKEKIFYLSFILLIFFSNFFIFNMFEKKKSINENILELIKEGKYKCCLMKSCTHCYLEEGKCGCLNNIVNYKAPCGECIGKILEGKGNKYLAQYFAISLANELGQENLGMFKKLIEKKYGVRVNEQY